MNVEFTKNSSGFDNNFNVVETPLAGATFKLECTHRHTDECVDSNGNYSIDHCIDPHTDPSIIPNFSAFPLFVLIQFVAKAAASSAEANTVM